MSGRQSVGQSWRSAPSYVGRHEYALAASTDRPQTEVTRRSMSWQKTRADCGGVAASGSVGGRGGGAVRGGRERQAGGTEAAAHRGDHDGVRLQQLRLRVRADVEAALAQEAGIEQLEAQQVCPARQLRRLAVWLHAAAHAVRVHRQHAPRVPVKHNNPARIGRRGGARGAAPVASQG